MNVDKVLIYSPNWIGDAVLAIPAMKTVRERFAEAEITLLVRPWVAGLFTSAPFVDSLWSIPRPAGLADRWRIARQIRERRFDLAFLFPNSFESALTIFLGRVPLRVGYPTDGRRCLLTDAIAPARNTRHQTQYYLDLVRMPQRPAAAPSIEITATPEEKIAARRLLAAEGVPDGEHFLVLNPGAAYGSAKRWGEDRFAAVGDRLSSDLHYRVVMIGSESEKAVSEQVRRHMRMPAAILTGKTTLETLIGVLSESSLLITNDSGPMHIAAALGIPTVAVFGSTDEHVTGPCGPHTRVVKHPVECSPCLLRECPIDHRCMALVTVEDVCSAAKDLLAEVGPWEGHRESL
jgi:heptosyltransferase-2